ncbi:MAG: hypothetical protein IJW70_02775 [Clostridia bacterium]|nr:hypothetical protein [Clostridia bacterium]
MKKILMMVLALFLCVGCFASCSAIEGEIGKGTSVALLDAFQTELESVEFDTLERYDDAALAQYTNELAADGVMLQGEITGVVRGYYENPETGDWVLQLGIGASMIEDVDTLVQYYQEQYATEIAEGRAEVTGAGWIVSVGAASIVLESDQ